MKSRSLIIVDVVLVLALLASAMAYMARSQETAYNSNVQQFVNQTEGMEQVASRYLLSEQQLCDSWAAAINGTSFSMEEALAYLRAVTKDSSSEGHLVYADTLEGFSTAAKGTDSSDCSVNYKKFSLFTSMNWEDPSSGETSLHVTRSYTNPITGQSSVAFCNKVSLAQGGKSVEAYLMRVTPLSYFKNQWVFPTSSGYEDAEVAIITSSGEYLLKANSLKNSSFFEFLKSYNLSNKATQSEITAQVTGTVGYLEAKNSQGNSCILAHVPMLQDSSTGANWIVIGYIPADALGGLQIDWMFSALLLVGFLLLLAVNGVYFVVVNRRLAASQREAEAASHAKSEFLSNMSHDIRTPMNAIVGLTSIASRKVDDPKAVAESLHKITLASNHLLTLVNDVLDISKVEAGDIALNPVVFSLASISENLVNIAQPTVKAKGIDFAFNAQGIQHEYVFADQLRINQVYINILSNAVKYTNEGGSVKVLLEQLPLKEDVGKVRMVYRVADTGIGMSEEFQRVMFDTFSRAADSRVSKTQGTGLGLSIAKRVVDLMGGTIECQSKENQGTTFTVTLDLPLASQSAAEVELPHLRVLLVDDDEVARETGAETLRELGADVSVAASGSEAIGMASFARSKNADYGLVAVDWKMPDMDGVEVATNLRKELGTSVPILVVSAYDWSDIEEEAKAAGVNGFVAKPLFKSSLAAKINEVLNSQPAPAEERSEGKEFSDVHVLVVEDNDLNWEIIDELLADAGIEATRCENGKLGVEEMESCAEGTYDLVFMDIQMPVMNGYEAARAIRASGRTYTRTIPIFAMTADAFSEDVARCMDAGMNGHISKPVDMKQVFKAIRSVKGGNYEN